MAVLGWLIRERFYQPQPKEKIRKKLGFKKDVFTLLVCGGSEGSNMVLKIIPALLAVKRPVQIMVVCGTNQTLFKTLNSFKKFLPKLAKTKINHLETLPAKLNLKLFRFTNNLAPLISVADLVVGKAGPNLIFESVALGKPFLAICHISGQEDANLSLIKKKRLGMVEENPIKAIKLLNKIVYRPQILTKFTPFIAKERQANSQAQEKLVQISQKLLGLNS